MIFTLEKIVLPAGILLPEPNAPVCPGIRKMPDPPHFVHLLVIFMMRPKSPNLNEDVNAY